MRVLIIPEDFRKDQHILKPLISRIFAGSGKRQARITVCQDPLIGGVSNALKISVLQDIVDRYRTADIFILCVDRDGNVGRRTQLDRIEAKFAKQLGANRYFLAENAWEELEVWILAGLRLPSNWKWREVRSDPQVKENYFDPFALRRGVSRDPSGGRRILADEAKSQVRKIRNKCPDDFDSLASRIESILS